MAPSRACLVKQSCVASDPYTLITSITGRTDISSTSTGADRGADAAWAVLPVRHPGCADAAAAAGEEPDSQELLSRAMKESEADAARAALLQKEEEGMVKSAIESSLRDQERISWLESGPQAQRK